MKLEQLTWQSQRELNISIDAILSELDKTHEVNGLDVYEPEHEAEVEYEYITEIKTRGYLSMEG